MISYASHDEISLLISNNNLDIQFGSKYFVIIACLILFYKFVTKIIGRFAYDFETKYLFIAVGMVFFLLYCFIISNLVFRMTVYIILVFSLLVKIMETRNRYSTLIEPGFSEIDRFLKS